jgi:predicted nucleic acid-binding Zn ribbon protein
MSWSSIDQVITNITQQPAWDAYRTWQEILDAWPQVLESLQIPNQTTADLATQIYPHKRSGDVLQVATNNAALADLCTWQRRSILKILNTTLTQPLTEIRFSSGRWQIPVDPTATVDQVDQSQIERAECPQCTACTPQWELERWSVCRFCIAASW